MNNNASAYLTYKLDLIKTLAIKSADAIYKKTLDVSLRELRVLRFIHDFPQITATELVDKLVLDKTQISKNISALERKELIFRTSNAHDNRLQYLALTEKGSRIWEDADKLGRRLEQDMFSELSNEEWQSLQNILDKVLHSLSAWKANELGE